VSEKRLPSSEKRLPSVDGVSKPHRGTSRPFIVSRVERELDGVDVVLIAHEACYVLWREESRAKRDT
jgi:hypothetical protein